jgi:hypothetical protein
LLELRAQIERAGERAVEDVDDRGARVGGEGDVRSKSKGHGSSTTLASSRERDESSE